MIVNLGPVDQIEPGMGKSFAIKGAAVDVAVFRGRNGKIFAIQNMCPHALYSLADGLMAEHTVLCPGHGHKFNLLTGKGSEENESVKIFKVWEENNILFLEYPQSVTA